jgi:preprotein translocase subunit SecE
MEYLSASRSELAKVSWPNRRQTIRLTLTVVAFSLVMAGFLGLLDKGFSMIIQRIIVKG